MARPRSRRDAGAEQLGASNAHDVKNGKTKPIYGMGRFNHESAVAIPEDFDDVVVLSGDDTFRDPPRRRHSCTCTRRRTRTSLGRRRARLHAFSWTDGTPESRQLLRLPRRLADDGSGSSSPYPTSPTKRQAALPTDDELTGLSTCRTTSACQRLRPCVLTTPRTTARGSATRRCNGIDGPQWVLEQWGDRNTVFDFIRIEDIAYDKLNGMSNVVYLADSAAPPTSVPKRSVRVEQTGASNKWCSTRLIPRRRSRFLLVQGDDATLKLLSEIHQPDNLETTVNGNLLVTEDPGSGNQYVPEDWDLPNATAARLWAVALASWVPASRTHRRRASLRSSTSCSTRTGYDVGPAEVPTIRAPAVPISPGNLGAWESSGIVDASGHSVPGRSSRSRRTRSGATRRPVTSTRRPLRRRRTSRTSRKVDS